MEGSVIGFTAKSVEKRNTPRGGPSGEFGSLGEDRPDDAYGDDAVIEPDKVLSSAVGRFKQVVVIVFDEDAQPHVCSSHGSRDALWLMKRGEHFLLFESD